MATFNDLAVELQETIWKLVLPVSRGVHWIEIDGIPHKPDFTRDSIRMTQQCEFDLIPEKNVYYLRGTNPEFNNRVRANPDELSSPFFRHLLTTVPAVFGQSGPEEDSKTLRSDIFDEIAYVSRCRQLSNYTQITALLSVCRLSRTIAMQYIQTQSAYSWPIHRSMCMNYRPHPIEI
jgi:hypothetical protein